MAFHALEVDFLKVNGEIDFGTSVGSTYTTRFGRYNNAGAFNNWVTITQNPSNGGSASLVKVGIQKIGDIVTITVPWFSGTAVDGAYHLEFEASLPVGWRPVADTIHPLIIGRNANNFHMEPLEGAAPTDDTIVASISTTGRIRICKFDSNATPPVNGKDLNLGNSDSYGFAFDCSFTTV